MKRLVPLIPLVFLLAIVSCSQPLVSEDFVKTSKTDSLGRYPFTLNMKDSVATWSVYFYTRIDASERTFATFPDLELDISLTSPSGKIFTETVYIPKSKYISSEHFTKDYYLPWRENFTPVELGTWTMTVALPQREKIRGFRGLGVRLITQK